MELVGQSNNFSTAKLCRTAGFGNGCLAFWWKSSSGSQQLQMQQKNIMEQLDITEIQ